MKKWFVLCLTELLLLASCELPVMQPSTPTGNFEALWTELDTKYCFFDYKAAEYGLDWNEVHARYAPLVNDNMTDRQLFDVLSSVVNELRDGHANLIAKDFVSQYSDFYRRYPHNFSSDLMLDILESAGYYYGSGVYYAILPDSVAYMRVGSFTTSFTDTFLTHLFAYFADCKGLVVDVRDNGGGDLTLAQTLAMRFMTKPLTVGYIAHKTGPAHDAFSKPEPIRFEPDTTLSRWLRPTCVLSNRHTFSAANDFVRNMKLLPQVTIVGDSTGGGSGLPMSTDLPNGWTLRYSACPMYDVNMNHTEFGIAPDIRVDLLPSDEARTVDTILQTALDLLKQ